MGEPNRHPAADPDADLVPGLESGDLPSGSVERSDDGLSAEDELLREVASLDAASPPLAVGQRVAHFRVLSELGRGGMGVVYLAEDTKLRRRVALKVLASTAAFDPERRKRLLREARTAAAVTHPVIASIYEVGESDGRVYIAMERVQGESLRQLLLAGPLPPERTVEIALQVLRGLAAAHAGGVIHRDLKPDNIMLGPHGVVKLLDFGLAKRSSSPGAPPGSASLGGDTTTLVTGEGRVMGTPAYMSPEQALGDPVDARSDIFSFGIVIYEMLSGQRPFGGNSSGAILGALLTKLPPALPSIVPLVSEPLARVVMRCLEKEPANRYGDCDALADELRAALYAPAGLAAPRAATSPPGGESRVVVRPAPAAALAVERDASGGASQPTVKRAALGRPRRAWIVVVIGVLLVTLAAGAAWWSRQAGPLAPAKPGVGAAPQGGPPTQPPG